MWRAYGVALEWTARRFPASSHLRACRRVTSTRSRRFRNSTKYCRAVSLVMRCATIVHARRVGRARLASIRLGRLGRGASFDAALT